MSNDDDIDYALVPFADLFNHDSFNEVVADVSNGVFTIKSMKKQIKGSQAFINYGKHPNAYFLLQYGFVPDNNKHDFIEFTLDQFLYLSQYSDKDKLELKKCLQRKPELFSDAYLYADGVSTKLINLIYIVIAEEEIWDKLLENIESEIIQLSGDYHFAASGLFQIGLKFVKDFVENDRSQFQKRCRDAKMSDESSFVVLVMKFFANWLSILNNALLMLSSGKNVLDLKIENIE